MDFKKKGFWFIGTKGFNPITWKVLFLKVVLDYSSQGGFNTITRMIFDLKVVLDYRCNTQVQEIA